jgi:hypothetical protein
MFRLTCHVTPRIVTPISRVTAERRYRMGGRSATRQQPAVRTRQVRSDPGPDGVHPAFQRAILKIAIELRKPNAASYETIVQATIQSLRLDEGDFRRYLGENGARNMSLLLATARAGGL